jgi:hypothetical protein
VIIDYDTNGSSDMAVPDDWVKTSVAITPGFEVSGDPYLGVSGDFDGMGISCGALQWNIGKKSLQPMVKAIGKTRVKAVMPDFGDEMWTACNGTISQGLSIVRSWQNGVSLRPKPKNELRALMGTHEMRAEQDNRIGSVADKAFQAATKWAKDRDNTPPSKRLFCWFFDLVTQNGGLEGLTPKKVADFIAGNSPDTVDDLICDFLETRPGNSGHVRDAKKNGVLWRNRATGEKLELLCLSYLRSSTADPQWRHVVLNRKGTISMGKGWVNSSEWNFAAHGL